MSGVCEWLIFIISIGILCISQEGLSLVDSNQQIWLLNKDILDLRKVNFCISKLLIQCNTREDVTGGVIIYIHMCVLVYWPLCVFVCACVISNQSTSKNHVKHTARSCCWYWSLYYFVKQNNIRSSAVTKGGVKKGDKQYRSGKSS